MSELYVPAVNYIKVLIKRSGLYVPATEYIKVLIELAEQ